MKCLRLEIFGYPQFWKFSWCNMKYLGQSPMQFYYWIKWISKIVFILLDSQKWSNVGNWKCSKLWRGTPVKLWRRIQVEKNLHLQATRKLQHLVLSQRNLFRLFMKSNFYQNEHELLLNYNWILPEPINSSESHIMGIIFFFLINQWKTIIK